ncbi:MAG: VOC family protein [Halobacteriaceae archaeon]
MPEPTAHHVGITVSDLDRAVAFYRDTFDFEVLSRFEVSGEAFATGVGVDDAEGQFAHLDADGVRVELIEYTPEGDDATPEAVNQPGAAHLGFSVGDLDAFYADLTGVETVSEPQVTSSGTKILFLRDPEDNLIEVIEA